MTSDLGNVTGTEEVSGKVARGAAMLTSARFLGRLAGFINTLILARLLVPEDFGLVALGFTILQLLQNVSDIGVAQAVIKYREDDEHQTDTLFTLSLLRGGVVAGLIAILAVPAGWFYEDPRVTPIFFAISGIAFAISMINPRFYEFERDMQFAREAIVTIVVKIVSVAVSVAVALIFKTFWAIVAGYAAGVIVQLSLSYLLKPYRPRLGLKSVRKLIGFSGWLTGVSALVAMNNKTEVLILGRAIGAEPTGVYHVGEQVASMSTMEIATPIARAVYPGLSSLQASPDNMRKTYLQGTEALAAIAMPAAVGSAFVATDMVAVLLGDKWAQAVPVLQVFAPVLGFMSIFLATQALAMAAGLTKKVFLRELTYFLIKTPIFIWAAVNYGLYGALAAAAIGCLFYSVLQSILYAQVTNRSPFEPVWHARRSILALGGMVLWFWGLRLILPSMAEWPVILRLFVDVAMGGLGYVAAHLAIWQASGRPEGIEAAIISLVQRLAGRKTVAAAP